MRAGTALFVDDRGHGLRATVACHPGLRQPQPVAGRPVRGDVPADCGRGDPARGVPGGRPARRRWPGGGRLSRGPEHQPHAVVGLGRHLEGAALQGSGVGDGGRVVDGQGEVVQAARAPAPASRRQGLTPAARFDEADAPRRPARRAPPTARPRPAPGPAPGRRGGRRRGAGRRRAGRRRARCARGSAGRGGRGAGSRPGRRRGRSVPVDWASWTTMPGASLGWRNASFQSRVGEVDADRAVAGGSAAAEGAVDVGHLEGQVVGAGALVIEEAAEEVVLLDPVGLEQLDLHAVGEGRAARTRSRVSSRERQRARGRRRSGARRGRCSMATATWSSSIGWRGTGTPSMVGLRWGRRRTRPSIGGVVQVSGFDHLVLAVQDVERSLAWYIGRARADRRAGRGVAGGGGALPVGAGRRRTIIDCGGRAVTAPTSTTSASWSSRSTSTRWRRRGASTSSTVPPASSGRGATGVGLYVRDPDGNVVELRRVLTP